MDLDQNDLLNLTSMVWESLVGLSLEPVSDATQADDCEPLLSASVHITGVWRRTVTVQCAESLARRIAQSMFQVLPGAVTDADESDSLGEIANVIAGHVKAASAISCGLSLPAVVSGDRSAIRSTVSDVRCQASFKVDGQLLSVLIHEPHDAEASV